MEPPPSFFGCHVNVTELSVGLEIGGFIRDQITAADHRGQLIQRSVQRAKVLRKKGLSPVRSAKSSRIRFGVGIFLPFLRGTDRIYRHARGFRLVNGLLETPVARVILTLP